MYVGGCTEWKHCNGCGALVRTDCCERPKPPVVVLQPVGMAECVAQLVAVLDELRKTLRWWEISERYGVSASTLVNIRRGVHGVSREVARKFGFDLERPVVPTFGERNCVVCGTTFVAKRVNQRYCVLKCYERERNQFARHLRAGKACAENTETVEFEHAEVELTGTQG